MAMQHYRAGHFEAALPLFQKLSVEDVTQLENMNHLGI